MISINTLRVKSISGSNLNVKLEFLFKRFVQINIYFNILLELTVKTDFSERVNVSVSFNTNQLDICTSQMKLEQLEIYL